MVDKLFVCISVDIIFINIWIICDKKMGIIIVFFLDFVVLKKIRVLWDLV